MSEKRRREKCEYDREYKIKKKEKAFQRSNLLIGGLFSSTFLSSGQTCMRDECEVIGSVKELM